MNEIPKIKLIDDFKITLLICYLLDNLGILTEKQLLETVTHDEIVGIFNFSDALGVVESKNLADFYMDGNEKVYEITQNGKILISEFSLSIPQLIREKMLVEGRRIYELDRLRKSLNWIVHKTNTGYEFRVKLLNEKDASSLMEIKLHAPTLEYAQKIEKRFLTSPAEIIKNIFYSFIDNGI